LKNRFANLYLFAIAAFLYAGPFAHAQSTPPFVLSVVSGDAQTTGLNQVFPQRLVVRLADSNGNPHQGAPVNFQDTSCVSLMGTPCEFPGAPGHFESGSNNATVITDALGIAVSPHYYAGGSLGSVNPIFDINPGAIGLEVIVLPDEPPYFFTISQALTHFAVFRLTQVAAPAVAATPALSLSALALLCILLVAAASVVLDFRLRLNKKNDVSKCRKSRTRTWLLVLFRSQQRNNIR
jgi:hypothetical protein